MMDELKTIPINCRGLAQAFKGRDVLNCLREKKPDIILLQEIHVKNHTANRFILEWGTKGLVSPCTSRSRGVAILFSNTFEYQVNDVIICSSGNCVLASVSLLDRTVTIGSICGKNEDDLGFYRNLFQTVHTMGNDEISLGGDWNLVLNPDLDYMTYRRMNNRKAKLLVFEEIDCLNLLDICRFQHPRKRGYTWSTNNSKKKHV